MPDDLVARCTAYARQAMEKEPHDAACVPSNPEVLTPAGDFVTVSNPRCCCDRDARLVARLGRMMAAGLSGAAIRQNGASAWYPAMSERSITRGLRAVERELEGTK